MAACKQLSNSSSAWSYSKCQTYLLGINKLCFALSLQRDGFPSLFLENVSLQGSPWNSQSWLYITYQQTLFSGFNFHAELEAWDFKPQHRNNKRENLSERIQFKYISYNNVPLCRVDDDQPVEDHPVCFCIRSIMDKSLLSRDTQQAFQHLNKLS